MDDSLGLIFKALRFAAMKHNDQRRKDARASPYINHPIQVAEILWSIGGVRDVDLLVASILHDTVEDTDATPEEIRSEFGADVLAIVLEVTDDKSLPKHVRKQLQVERGPFKSHNARLLKIADKISNVVNIMTDPPRDWSLEEKREYLLWSERVVAGMRGTNSELESYYDAMLADGKLSLGI